jgi:hypothetical protein
VAQLAGIPVAYQFSNDYRGVQGAILEGVPVPQRSSLGQSIMALARSLALEFFHIAVDGPWRD